MPDCSSVGRYAPLAHHGTQQPTRKSVLQGGIQHSLPPSIVLERLHRGRGCFSGFDENLDVQGELILQDAFQVWDPKSLIRKGRERHLFLFEISLVFSKEIKDSSGHTKYVYKNKLLVGGAGGPESLCFCRACGAGRDMDVYLFPTYIAHLFSTPKFSRTKAHVCYLETSHPQPPLLHLRVHRSSCLL